MSGDTRFQPGHSGNPKGRPRKPRRPHLSAFEIILDKRWRPLEMASIARRRLRRRCSSKP